MPYETPEERDEREADESRRNAQSYWDKKKQTGSVIEIADITSEEPRHACAYRVWNWNVRRWVHGNPHAAVSGNGIGGRTVTDKLKRVRQCEKCPWKVSTDPHTIPSGYSEQRHCNLSGTVAKPGDVRGIFGGTLRIFACHESPVGDEVHCVGWLMNQLGPGNNIALRMDMMRCENLKHVQLDGPQHETFEDTLSEQYSTDRNHLKGDLVCANRSLPRL